MCTVTVSVQGLMGLTGNLRVSVLRSSQMPVLKQLSRLPRILYMAALHSGCPSIATDHSLRLGDMKGSFSKQDVDALGRLFASLSSLQHLDLHGNKFGDAGARTLGPQLANLSSLHHLVLHCNRVGAELSLIHI